MDTKEWSRIARYKTKSSVVIHFRTLSRGRRGIDRMVVGFTTTYVIGTYHN